MSIQKGIQIVTILFLGAIMNSCGLFLQKSGVKNYTLKEKIEKKGLNKYQYDFVYLSHLVEQGFPEIDNIFPEIEREKQKAEVLNALASDDIKKINFAIQCRKFLSNLHNEHTSIYVKAEFPTVYPFRIHISYDNWYLSNIDIKQDSVFIGKQIIKINEIDINEIENRLINFTFAENKINQQYEIRRNRIYNKPLYLKEVGVIKELKESIKISFTDSTFVIIDPVNSGEKFDLYNIKFPNSGISKQDNNIYSYKIYPNQNFGYLQFRRCHDTVDVLESIESYIKPWLQSITKGYVKRQFKKENPPKRMAQYFNPEHPVFKDFVWELIDSLNNNKIENFIIDLRQNPGGNSILGVQLLYFLTAKMDLKNFAQYAYTSDIYKRYFPVEYDKLNEIYPNGIPNNELVLENENAHLFDKITNKESPYYISKDRPIFGGNIYIIANYSTGSAAAILTTLFQDSNIGTIIGTSVGNNPTGATTYTPFKLPKTKANVSIATIYQERPNKQNGKILQPDFWVEYSLDDLTTGNDPFLEKVQELIEEGNRQ